VFIESDVFDMVVKKAVAEPGFSYWVFEDIKKVLHKNIVYQSS
jgi:hypothetical protein